MTFEKHRRLKKDTQIQIYKPTQRETPMKSKTQHIDGGGSSLLFEAFRICRLVENEI